jgi:hypothetical protein
LSIIQGPFSVAPCQTLISRFATFSSPYCVPPTRRFPHRVRPGQDRKRRFNCAAPFRTVVAGTRAGVGSSRCVALRGLVGLACSLAVRSITLPARVNVSLVRSGWPGAARWGGCLKCKKGGGVETHVGPLGASTRGGDQQLDDVARGGSAGRVSRRHQQVQRVQQRAALERPHHPPRVS